LIYDESRNKTYRLLLLIGLVFEDTREQIKVGKAFIGTSDRRREEAKELI